AQESQKQRLPVRQLEGIVMHMRLLAVDLPEDRGLVPRGAGSAINGDLRAEGELGAGKDADRRGRIIRSRKSARARSEVGGSKLVADACRPRFDMHQAVIAHGTLLLYSLSRLS